MKTQFICHNRVKISVKDTNKDTNKSMERRPSISKSLASAKNKALSVAESAKMQADKLLQPLKPVIAPVAAVLVGGKFFAEAAEVIANPELVESKLLELSKTLTGMSTLLLVAKIGVAYETYKIASVDNSSPATERLNLVDNINWFGLNLAEFASNPVSLFSLVSMVENVIEIITSGLIMAKLETGKGGGETLGISRAVLKTIDLRNLDPRKLHSNLAKVKPMLGGLKETLKTKTQIGLGELNSIAQTVKTKFPTAVDDVIKTLQENPEIDPKKLLDSLVLKFKMMAPEDKQKLIDRTVMTTFILSIMFQVGFLPVAISAASDFAANFKRLTAKDRLSEAVQSPKTLNDIEAMLQLLSGDTANGLYGLSQLVCKVLASTKNAIDDKGVTIKESTKSGLDFGREKLAVLMSKFPPPPPPSGQAGIPSLA